jgi:hypothetical protein
MDTTTSVVITVVIVAVGQWSKKDGKLSIKLVIGMMALTLMLSAIENSNEKFARQFAALILVAALLIYLVPITKKLGLNK